MVYSGRSLFSLVFSIIGFVSFFLPWIGIKVFFIDESISGVKFAMEFIDKGEYGGLVLLIFPIIFLVIALYMLKVIKLNEIVMSILKIIPIIVLLYYFLLAMAEGTDAGFSYGDVKEFWTYGKEVLRIGLILTIMSCFMVLLTPKVIKS